LCNTAEVREHCKHDLKKTNKQTNKNFLNIGRAGACKTAFKGT